MKKVWLFLFPLLFLPNFGNEYVTPFGVLDQSDYFIGPYLFCVGLAAKPTRKTVFDNALWPLLIFSAWTLLSTISIGSRFGYSDLTPVINSLLKLAKFTVYALAGYLTVKAVTSERKRQQFLAALLVAGVVVGVGLSLVGKRADQIVWDGLSGYKAANGISVMAAILFSYLVGLWMTRKGLDQKLTLLMSGSIAMLILGMGVSLGRGGWVAALAGLTYILFTVGVKLRTLLVVGGLTATAITVYSTSEVVQQRVAWTLNPDPLHMQAYGGGIGGIDDGARLKEWMSGVEQFREPILGTGFFHRGGETGIYTTGTHNFYLQMFLETGIPGGVAMVLFFLRLWQMSRMSERYLEWGGLPERAALIAAVTGGLSGEYFYGGIVLFMLFAVFAVTGSLAGVNSRVANPIRRMGNSKSA